MENGLMLLMRDGPVRCAFSPRLTAEQYDELGAIVRRLSDMGTSGDLIQAVQLAAERWAVTAVFRRDRD